MRAGAATPVDPAAPALALAVGVGDVRAGVVGVSFAVGLLDLGVGVGVGLGCSRFCARIAAA